MTQTDSKMSLRDIVSQSNLITQSLIETGGELSPELETQLQVNETTLAAKVDGYAAIIDRMTMESDYFKAKAKEYAQLARSHERVSDNLWERIKEAMILMDRREVAGDSVKFKLAACKPRLVVDEEKVDLAYKRQVIVTELHREKLLADLNAGEIITGARLEGGFTLRVSKVGAAK